MLARLPLLRRGLTPILALALGVLGVVTVAAPAHAAPPVYVVAGDSPGATGDQWGLHEAYFSELRAAITDPSAFGASGTVDAVYQIGSPRNVPLGTSALDGIDVYFLAARDVAPSEVPVLQAFLARGGALVVHANAPSFFDTTWWLGFTLGPRVVYGDGAAPYTTTHRAPSPSTVVASHSVVNGSFGQVSSFENWHTVAGWTSVPAAASVLARTTLSGPDDNGSANIVTITNVATLAAIPAGALGSGWGPVLATSDVDTFSNAYTSGGIGYGATDALCTLTNTSNGRLARNAFAWIAAQKAILAPPSTTTTTASTTTTTATTTTTPSTTAGGPTTSPPTTAATTTTAGTSTTLAATTTTTGAANPSTDGFTPLAAPVRVLDTRSGAPLGPGGSRTVDVRRAGVPAGATMAVVNLTAVDPTADGYLVAHRSDAAVPDSSNVNFLAGTTVADAAFVALAADGTFSVRNAFGDTHVLVDLTGYLAPGGARFVASAPTRIKDTRTGLGGTGRAGPATTQQLAVGGVAGVPADATAVVLNLTVVDPTSATYATAWPADRTRPEVSNINVGAGVTAPNLVVVRLDAAGAIRLFNAFGEAHLLVDVFGWFTTTAPSPASGAVDAHRVLDTRQGGAPLQPGGTRTVSVGLPGATAVVVTVTGVDATEAGYLTLHASDAPRPGTSNLNLRPGVAVPNLVVVHPAADGTIRVYNAAGSTHVIIDVVARLG